MPDTAPKSKAPAGRYAVVIGVLLINALIHAFRVGMYLPDKWRLLYYGYFSDIAIPFGFYFMLCMYDINVKFLRPWLVKALIIFGIAAITETAQAFGIYLLGVTFDPLDYVMFATGVLSAAFLDAVVLTRATKWWAIRDEDGGAATTKAIAD